MPYLVLFVVIVAVAFLLYRTVQDVQTRAQGEGTLSAGYEPPQQTARPKKPKRQRKPLKAIDTKALSQHVEKLRSAVQAELISEDEAVASIIRYADGALAADDARRMLQAKK